MIPGRTPSSRVVAILTALVLAGGVFVLSAPRPLAARAVQQAPSCVVGEWTAVDLESYLRSVVESERVHIERVSGAATLAIRPDGTLTETFSGVVAGATFGDSAIEVGMDGTIEATYTEDVPGALTVTPTAVNVVASVTLDGVALPASGLGDFVGGASTINYDCDAGTLLLAPDIPDRAVQPQVFRRS